MRLTIDNNRHQRRSGEPLLTQNRLPEQGVRTEPGHLWHADVTASPQAQMEELGKKSGVRPTGHGAEGPWLVCNRNSTVNQLLLLGVKAGGLSLSEETAGDRFLLTRWQLKSGCTMDRRGGLLTFWPTNDLDRQPP